MGKNRREGEILKARAPKHAAQQPPPMGHNSPPLSSGMLALRISQAIGKPKATPLEPFRSKAPWVGYAKTKEKVALSRIQRRLDRKKQSIADLKADQNLIMARCIRRMRRAEGKEK